MHKFVLTALFAITFWGAASLAQAQAPATPGAAAKAEAMLQKKGLTVFH